MFKCWEEEPTIAANRKSTEKQLNKRSFEAAFDTENTQRTDNIADFQTNNPRQKIQEKEKNSQRVPAVSKAVNIYNLNLYKIIEYIFNYIFNNV